jgi:hypothetical protein
MGSSLGFDCAKNCADDEVVTERAFREVNICIVFLPFLSYFFFARESIFQRFLYLKIDIFLLTKKPKSNGAEKEQ